MRLRRALGANTSCSCFLSRENPQAIVLQLGKPGLIDHRALELFTRKKTSIEPIKVQSSASEDIDLSQAVLRRTALHQQAPRPRHVARHPTVALTQRRTGPQDLNTMGRDRRCALYQGEPRHTLGTTDTHEMYLSLFPKVSPGSLPFDSDAHHVLQNPNGFRLWGKRYMETMYISSCRYIFEIGSRAVSQLVPLREDPPCHLGRFGAVLFY